MVSEGVCTRTRMVSEGVCTRTRMVSEGVCTRTRMVSEGVCTRTRMVSEGVCARTRMVSEGVHTSTIANIMVKECTCYFRHTANSLSSTPEMWPPLYSGHSEKSQSMLYSTNSPLK